MGCTVRRNIPCHDLLFNGLFTYTETDTGSDPYPKGLPHYCSVATAVP